MKKTLAILLCLMLALCVPTVLAEETPEKFTSGDYVYILQDDGTTMITYPPELDGYTVTAIGEKAFASKSGIYSVILPDSVTFIGEDVFGEGSDSLVLTVDRDSCARQYAIDNGIEYTYPDANDWLNS